jgi:hypothetical protein
MNILEFLKSASPKTWLIFLLAAAVLIGVASVGTHSGGGKTAGAVDLEEYAQLPDYPVQDLRIWGQGEVRMSDEPLNMTGYRLYKYKLSREVLEEYIAMMQSNGFTLVGSHSDSSFLGSYQSYGLMCDGATDIPTIQQMYTDTPCHVNIWKSDSKWWVEVADGVALCDMGLRRDGSVESILPQGESVAAGLRRISGGYKTSDGRLQAKLGEAAVILGGETVKASATWKRSGEKVTVTVKITDELSAEITYQEKDVQQDDIFRLETVEEYPATVTLIADDERISARPTGVLSFRCASLRFMHLDEEGNVALYLYAEPLNTLLFPESVELFCAVNTTPEQKEEGGGSGGGGSGGGGIDWGSHDEPYIPDHSKLDCLTCGGDGDCNTCGGYGEVERYAGGGDTVTSKCSSCYGSGNCRTCGGSGKR